MVERLEDRVLLTTLDVTATITADNHYGLFSGEADGSKLTLLGWNEPGLEGDPGPFNWSLPETWNFSVGEGDYLYVVAWDDGGPQMWSGQFTLSDGSTVYSDTASWVYTVASGPNPTASGSRPSVETVMSDIASAEWSVPAASAPYGSGPWFAIPGLSPGAQLLWHDTLGSDSSSDSHYVVFRTGVPLVPDVPNAPPHDLHLGLNSQTIYEGGAVTLNGVFTDPDVGDIHNVIIEWGAGQVSSTLNLAVGVSSFRISHRYQDDPSDMLTDSYAIRVTVTDSEGASASSTINVTVGNVAPVVTALTSSARGCGRAMAGDAITVFGTFTDPGTLDTHSASIDWGDGTVTTGEINARSFTGSHAYSAGGIYPIAVNVWDDDGGASRTFVTAVLIAGVGVSDGVLYVVGTEDADHITVNRQGNSWFKVHADFLTSHNFKTVSSRGVRQIVVIGCGGDDHVNVAGNIRSITTIVHGADYTALDSFLDDWNERRNQQRRCNQHSSTSGGSDSSGNVDTDPVAPKQKPSDRKSAKSRR
jgi:hypothetical protein